MDKGNDTFNQLARSSADLQEESNEIEEILEEMKQKGPILAHPMMYVSALHNKQGRYPVNQDDDFFKRNNIEFIQLPPKDENREVSPPQIKYSVTIDDSGSFRHSVRRID